jgi:hypothetical protein
MNYTTAWPTNDGCTTEKFSISTKLVPVLCKASYINSRWRMEPKKKVDAFTYKYALNMSGSMISEAAVKTALHMYL